MDFLELSNEADSIIYLFVEFQLKIIKNPLVISCKDLDNEELVTQINHAIDRNSEVSIFAS